MNKRPDANLLSARERAIGASQSANLCQNGHGECQRSLSIACSRAACLREDFSALLRGLIILIKRKSVVAGVVFVTFFFFFFFFLILFVSLVVACISIFVVQIV